MSARLFIRNDDVITLDRKFRFFFDLAMDHGLPVVHAVIPGKIDQKAIRFLCRAKEKTPHLLDIVQHGWMHTNYSVKTGIKYEFGALRPLKQQRKDIGQGFKKMRSSFGGYFTPAFVPPYHGYDERTIKLIDEFGFKVFSAGIRRPGKPKRCIEIPAQVSFSKYGKGRVSVHSAKDVVGLLASGIHRRALSGVVTHHADFATAESRRELKKFFEYIKALEVKEAWRVLLFSDILSGHKKG